MGSRVLDAQCLLDPDSQHGTHRNVGPEYIVYREAELRSGLEEITTDLTIHAGW